MFESLARFTNVTTVNLSKEERWISLAVGALLLLYSAIRIPLTAVLAAIAAAYLFFRGLRGFCYIYDGLQVNTAVHNRPALKDAPNHLKGNDFRPMSYSSAERLERSSL